MKNSLFPSAPWLAATVSGIGCALLWMLCWIGKITIPVYIYATLFAVLMVIFSALFEYVVYRKMRELHNFNQREIKRLRDIEHYRRDFLGEVSHELKTPIFATQGFLHTLMDGAMDDPKVRIKFLKKAIKNADRLASLVEDLLIITKAESGEMVIRVRPFLAYDLVLEVVDMLDIKFTRKGRNIQCKINSNRLEDIQVLADRERIQQVLINLVDNAVKYGNPMGTIQIDITSDNGKLWIAVTDDGPGIAPEHIAHLFRRFYRVDKSRSREGGGTGLGLSICKHLIEAHGEQIMAHSVPGKGATFRFSLKIV